MPQPARPVSQTSGQPISRNHPAAMPVRTASGAAAVRQDAVPGQTMQSRPATGNTVPPRVPHPQNGSAGTAASSAHPAVPKMPAGQNPAAQNIVSAPKPAQPTQRPAVPGQTAQGQRSPAPRQGQVQRPVTPGSAVSNGGQPRQREASAALQPGRPNPAARMGSTRVTDMSAIQRSNTAVSAPVRQIKPKMPRFERTEVVYEDEGGNTVVSIVKAVVYMIFVMIISIFLAITVIKVGNDVFAFVKDDVSIDVKIPEYATLDDITQILYENEVILYPKVFKLYAELKKDSGEYIAGDYVVSPNMSYDELRAFFKPQPKVGISRITIPEGYTTDEIIDLMVSYGIGTREGYEEAIREYDFDYWFLDELEENGVDEDRIYRLDGYLFPDTYDFYNSSSEVTVLDKLLKRFGQIFTKEYKIQAQLLGYSVDDIINLASLIEKEAANPSEFFKVSSVFHNRLKYWKQRPMLESDATIVYAIQHETGERPKLTSTDYDTPYNTYQYAGLPPGPIANPSASAILAALSPADTEYYYFVADGNVSYFSATKEQHEVFINEIKKGTIRTYYAGLDKDEIEAGQEFAVETEATP